MKSSNDIFQLKIRKFTFPHLQKKVLVAKDIRGGKNLSGFPFKKAQNGSRSLEPTSCEVDHIDLILYV